MPRVSEAHLAARRDQILEAAQLCFSRNGFHATSMHDVIAEAGLSVGAVYRYFKSKEQLRRAISERHIAEISAALDELLAHEPALPMTEVMSRAVDTLEPRLSRHGVASIALQVWAEATCDPEVGAFVGAAMDRLRSGVITLTRRAQAAGYLPAEADPEAIGLALFGLLPGFVVQRLLTGKPSAPALRAAIQTLLTTPCR